MPLESIGRLMQAAQQRNYAVGYFESWNLESLQGVIDAAEKANSPIIVGFNGDFLRRRPGATAQDVTIYATLGIAVAKQARVPCGFVFNECSEDAWVKQAIVAGFNLVMLVDSKATLNDYKTRVMRLVALAHARGIAIEAEIDELPCGGREGSVSTPEAAADFVAATQVDLLAVSVGNEHIRLKGRIPLNLDRLREIHKRVSIPLVLHGGSGIADKSLKAAVLLGVRKINYGTYLKQRYLEILRHGLSRDQVNPHVLLGDGGEADLMVLGRAAVRDAVLERIEVLGCCGRA
jgi:ketose-bisphosphate aldolase